MAPNLLCNPERYTLTRDPSPVEFTMAKAKKTPPAKATESAAPATDSTLSTVQKAVVKAAGTVASAVTQVADTARAHVVTPVAEAVGLVEKKKARPARPKKKSSPAAKAAPLPPRSTTAAGKLISKNLKAAPKEGPPSGPTTVSQQEKKTTGRTKKK
jgi:hypothetical protein